MRIFERNPTPLLHNQGAGVVAGGDTQAFFNKYDATGRPIAVISKLRQYLDLQGNQIHEEGTIQKMTSWDLLYYLLRANFDGVESGYCKVPEPLETDGQGTYEYGHKVNSVKEVGEQVELQYEDKGGKVDTTTADVVIGADGPSSTLRNTLVSNVERNYAGYVAWRGTVPEQEASPTAKETFVEKFTFCGSYFPSHFFLIHIAFGVARLLQRLNIPGICLMTGSSYQMKILTPKSFRPFQRHADTILCYTREGRIP